MDPIDQSYASFDSHGPARAESLLYRKMAQKRDAKTSAIYTEPDAEEDGSQLQASTRNPVVTPQCLVIQAASVPKSEAKRRKVDCINKREHLLAPVPASDNECNIQKGQIVMVRLRDDATFSTHLSADTEIEVVGSLNGLTNDVQLGVPGVAQVNSHPGDHSDGQAQTSVVLHGVQTVQQFGSERIHAGDKLMVGRYAPLVLKEGKLAPQIMGPDGVSEEEVRIPLVPLKGNSLHTFIQSIQDTVRVHMGLPAFLTGLGAVTTPAMLRTLLHETCDKIFTDEKQVQPDQPVRGLAVLFAARRHYQMLCIEDSKLFAAVDPKQRAAHLRIALETCAQACIDCENRYQSEGAEYGQSLPHDSEHADAYSVKRSKSTLASLLNPGRSMRMLEFSTRINMHVEEQFLQFYARIGAYFGRYFFGTALSPADKGNSLDVFVGK